MHKEDGRKLRGAVMRVQLSKGGKGGGGDGARASRPAYGWSGPRKLSAERCSPRADRDRGGRGSDRRDDDRRDDRSGGGGGGGDRYGGGGGGGGGRVQRTGFRVELEGVPSAWRLRPVPRTPRVGGRLRGS